MLPQFKKSIMGASGGYATGLWMVWETQPLWKTIEAIEIVAALQEDSR